MARICNAEYVCLAVPSIELDTSLIHTDYLPRERVTRCRYCIHYSDEIGGYCELLEFANTDMQDGFCAWGSPREEH